MSGYAAPPPVAHRPTGARRVDWLDPVKALALLAIMLNHLVEEFGPGPWFTNPDNAWPLLAIRMHTIIPAGATIFLRGVRTVGWLGDAAPGVFILASGVGLTLSALAAPGDTLNRRSFYRRRLLRLFPLYIAMHFVILAGALLVPGSTLSFAGVRTALSLSGVRALPGLFFYISPSWWFVWLILQLYAVYPYLFRALCKLGSARFFALALAVTVASRAIGLELPRGRYAWLTGLFFASRLAEFAVGMVVAQMIVARRERANAPPLPSATTIASGSLACYVLGLLASFTFTGALISNLLVTVGMTGLFWVVWESMLRPEPRLAASAQWLGRRSYAVFLIHQPPLQWTASWFGAARSVHLVAALAALGISVPAGALLEDGVARAMTWRVSNISLATRRGLALVLALAIAALSVYLGAHESFETGARAGAWMCAAALLALAVDYWYTRQSMLAAERLVALAALFGGALELLIAPGTSGTFALGVGAAAACVLMVLGARTISLLFRAVAAAALAIAFAIGGEAALRRFAPLETAVWGELPALESHPTRTYALIPNRVTHLRYNDYDYTVRTNSLGLTSPEIPVARPTPNTFRVYVAGDAFAMPEGLDYAQSFPSILGKRLQSCLSPRAVQVIDGGVTGYGPNEERTQLAELAPQYRPDVIVDQFYINEFTDVVATPAEFRESIGLNLASRGVVRRFRDRSQLKTRFGRVERAAVESLTGHPATWRYQLSMLDYYRTGDNAIYDAHTMRVMAEALAGMKQVADTSGSRLLIAFVPGAVAVTDPARLTHLPRGENPRDANAYDLSRPYRALRQIADSLGIATVDLTSALRSSADQPTYYPAAWHWTAAGHRAAAGAIAGTLGRFGALGSQCQ
jgi:peptidoglycan/LPS O-acetylase OafA/YrhL